MGIQANITPLAARRCVTPTHKLKLILTDQLASFALGYVDVIILILYLRYILNLDFQGQMGKNAGGIFFRKSYRCVHGNVYRQFRKNAGRCQDRDHAWNLHGKQFPCGTDEWKHERYGGKSAPVCKPDNPASLIADAFYCIMYMMIRQILQKSLATAGQ